MVPNHAQERRCNTCATESCSGSTVIRPDRTMCVLHLYDSGGGWRKKAYRQEVVGHLYPNLAGKLHPLACDSIGQFSPGSTFYANPVCIIGIHFLDGVPQSSKLSRGRSDRSLMWATGTVLAFITMSQDGQARWVPLLMFYTMPQDSKTGIAEYGMGWVVGRRLTLQSLLSFGGQRYECRELTSLQPFSFPVVTSSTK